MFVKNSILTCLNKHWTFVYPFCKFANFEFLQGVAQYHSALFVTERQRMPGLTNGQIYTYPSKRWRKKRRQYLINFFQPRKIKMDIDDGLDIHTENLITGASEDSKDSLALKGGFLFYFQNYFFFFFVYFDSNFEKKVFWTQMNTARTLGIMMSKTCWIWILTMNQIQTVTMIMKKVTASEKGENLEGVVTTPAEVIHLLQIVQQAGGVKWVEFFFLIMENIERY